MQALLPIVLVVVFGAYAVWTMSKRKGVQLAPAYRRFFEQTGYRHVELGAAPLDAHAQLSEQKWRDLASGKPLEVHLVRDFHGLPVRHDSFLGGEYRGLQQVTTMSCAWTTSIGRAPAVPMQIADKSLAGVGKAIKEAFTNTTRTWAPIYPTRIETGDAELDKRFVVYGTDADCVRRALAALRDLLLGCGEVDSRGAHRRRGPLLRPVPEEPARDLARRAGARARPGRAAPRRHRARLLLGCRRVASLLLVRHGQASYGEADYDRLSERGREQAKTLGAALGRLDAVFTGPHVRQRQTAELAGLTAEPIAEFAEYPAFEMLQHLMPRLVAEDPKFADLIIAPTPRLLDEAFHSVLSRWSRDEWHDEKLERVAVFVQRVRRGIVRAIATASRGARIAVVTSAGPIGVAVGGVFGIDGERMVKTSIVVRNASITELVFDTRKPDRMSLMTFNLTAHLPPDLTTER